MSDDFSSLAPTDPTPLAPEWRATRQEILDGLLTEETPRRSHAWRWVAGVAAAALVVVAVGGAVQQLRPEPYTLPASPAPTDGIAPEDQVLAARDTLLDTGTGMTLCTGFLLESLPPQCPATIPVTGITWEEVPWAETAAGVTFADVVIVGTFDGEKFAATQILRQGDPAAPQAPGNHGHEDLPTLCDAPIRGAGPYSVEALASAAESLPGYQALWVSPNQVTYNVAVTQDVEGARSTLADVFGGDLCVGTVAGPTDAALQEAQRALEPLAQDEDSPTTSNGVRSTAYSISARGNRLSVGVLQDTPELLAQIETLVGAEMWPFTDVAPFFYRVTNTPTTPKAPAPTPSALPQGTGTYIAQGGVEYRDGRVSLCYSTNYADINSCRAAVPLLGVDPQDIDWDSGSAAAGNAFVFDVVVVGTLEDGGLRVERLQEDFLEREDIDALPTSQDPAMLAAAAAELVSSYDGDPFVPTTEVQEVEGEGVRLIVRVLLTTDDAVARVREILGEDVWRYTYVEPFIATLES